MKRSILSISLSLLFIGGFSYPVSADSNVPTVYVVNDTVVDGVKDWPISAAIRNWNRNNHLRIIEVDSCDGYVRCSLIREWLYPADYDGAGTYNLENYEINFNATMELSYRARKMAVCHEIGHFLGLGHSSRFNAGCMRYYLTPSPQPHAGERNRIRAALKLTNLPL